MVEPFDRFTQSAYGALIFARTEAQRLNHPAIDPEHLLLGLTMIDNGAALEIMAALNVNPALVRSGVEGRLVQGPWRVREALNPAPATSKVIDLAVAEAARWGHGSIGTEHLLAGLAQIGQGVAAQVLAELGISLDQVRAQIQQRPSHEASLPPPSAPVGGKPPVTISPIFGLIFLVTALAALATYQRFLDPRLTVFLFVLGGWVVSLCLHEFGHALVAYLGGDDTVADQGYLTLNPLKYTHGLLSIGLPLLYLALGGIGLPGGAVYIRLDKIRSKRMQSLTSAAGPIATAVCAVIVLLPFALGIADAGLDEHFEFWAGLAFLGSLEVIALVLNLLPIPGLDGFGIIAPFLPEALRSRIRGFGSYTLLIVFMLFYTPAFNRGFWSAIIFITTWFKLRPDLAYQGLRLFQFWIH